MLHALRDVRPVIGFESGYDAGPFPREVESSMKSFAQTEPDADALWTGGIAGVVEILPLQ